MDQTYSFNGADAAQYGLHPAIILYHLRWWIAKNKANGKHHHEGKTWTYNSRKAFVELFPFLTEDQIRRALEKLVETGAVVKGNFNETGYDRTMWYALRDEGGGYNAQPPIGQRRPMDLAKLPNGSGDVAQPIPDVLPDKKQHPAGGGGGGFGLKEEEAEEPTTDFDRQIATQLEAAVRTRPPRTTGITQARPSTWATHIRLLRTKDGFTEDEIATAMKWYAVHIGEDFVPEAYSGEAFRKKFPAILKKAERKKALDVVPGTAATKIAGRYGLNGKTPALAVAVEVVLTRYSTWRERMVDFAERVERDDLVNDYDAATRKRIARYIKGLLGYMPHQAPSYAQAWADRTVDRVRNWDGWSGDFTPLLINTDGKDFWGECIKALGQYIGGDKAPGAWDEITSMMHNESH